MPDNLGKRLARQVHPRTSEFVHFAHLGIRRCNEARRNSDLIGAGPCGTNPVRSSVRQVTPDNLGKRLVGQVLPRTSEFVHYAHLEFAVATRDAGNPLLGLPQNLKRGGSGPRTRDLTARPPEADLLANVVRINRENALLTPT